MPTYQYKCKSCNHEFETYLKIDDRKKPEKKPCPSCGKKQVEIHFGTPPAIGDPIRMGIKKPDKEFTQLLKRIKKNNRGSTISDKHF